MQGREPDEVRRSSLRERLKGRVGIYADTALQPLEVSLALAHDLHQSAG